MVVVDKVRARCRENKTKICKRDDKFATTENHNRNQELMPCSLLPFSWNNEEEIEKKRQINGMEKQKKIKRNEKEALKRKGKFEGQEHPYTDACMQLKPEAAENPFHQTSNNPKPKETLA